MTTTKTESQGGKAVAEGGLVLLDGPDGVAVAMTPQAARDTAHELLAAADQAAGQDSVADGSAD
jgi:hypothetical protein